MPIYHRDVISLVDQVLEGSELKVTVKESMKGGLICGAACFAGGLMAGPVGLAIGGAVGGMAAAMMTTGKFRSIPEVVADMSPQQQKALANNVLAIVHNLGATDIVGLTALVLGNMEIRKQILEAVVEYVKSDMRMEIMD